MAGPQKPLPLFVLPDWCRWHAWIEISPALKAQIFAFQTPSGVTCFYPIFLDRDLVPLNLLPSDVAEAARDGKSWWACPEFIFYSENKGEIVVDHIFEADHPRPAGAERQIVSIRNFQSQISQSLRSSYGPDMKDPSGDIPPRLADLDSSFEKRKVEFFEKTLRASKSLPTNWGREKPRPRSHKKK